MLGRIKKLFKILYYYFTDSDNLLLYLLEIKAYEVLNGCYKLSVKSTEEIEDLIFHIRTYLEIPRILLSTRYPEFRGLDINIKSLLKKYKEKKLSDVEISLYEEYFLDIEKQRAVERDFIFESAKVLTFGFDF